MTIQELSLCPPGTMLFVSGVPGFKIFMRLSFSGRASVTDGGMYNASDVSLIPRGIKTLAVTNLTTPQNTKLQQAGIKLGLRWNEGGVVMFTEEPGLVLSFRNFRFYFHPDMGNPYYYYLSAADPFEWLAACWYVDAAATTLTFAEVVGEDIIGLIKQAPTNPMLRGIIRAKTGKAVPVETIALGSDAILKWLEESIPAGGGKPAPQQEPDPVETIDEDSDEDDFDFDDP